MRGIIEVFNKLCRNIASGLEKTPDVILGSIRFHNTHFVTLLIYIQEVGYIRGKLNNEACSSLGTMLYL